MAHTSDYRLPALVTALVLSVGCSAWPFGPAAPEAPALEGWTHFPAYRTQADFTEVAAAATVSLIDPGASRTLATSLTDASGRFRLSFSGFHPVRQVYFLEAIKGLRSNAVGQDSVRIRTLIAWNGTGWTSLTSALPGLPIVLDASTTALCIIQSLRQGGAGAVDPATLIGSVMPGGQPPFTPGSSGVTDAEFTRARSLVLTALLEDVDPLDAVIAANGTYALKPGIFNEVPVILSGLLPKSASVGMTVTLLGQGFATSPTESTVSFTPSRVAPVLTASASALTVQVPAGATTGTVTLTTNGVTATASFVVLPPVNGAVNP